MADKKIIARSAIRQNALGTFWPRIEIVSVGCEQRPLVELGKARCFKLSTAVDNFVRNYFSCLHQPFNQVAVLLCPSYGP
jgi:hypothetical protein